MHFPIGFTFRRKESPASVLRAPAFCSAFQGGRSRIRKRDFLDTSLQMMFYYRSQVSQVPKENESFHDFVAQVRSPSKGDQSSCPITAVISTTPSQLPSIRVEATKFGFTFSHLCILWLKYVKCVFPIISFKSCTCSLQNAAFEAVLKNLSRPRALTHFS